jgi:hypothetical protein
MMTNDKGRRPWVVVLALVLGCQVAVTGAQPPTPEAMDLVIRIGSANSVYSLRDPIELEFTLENRGRSQQVVPRHLKLRTNIRLEILDQRSQPARWCGRLADELVFVKSNYRTLAPGESLQERLAISCKNAAEPGLAWGYAISTRGKYTLKATYQLTLPKEYFKKAFPRARVVTAPVSSEPVTIELR